MIIPLKRKYRNSNSRLLKRDGVDPPEGTRVFMATSYKSKSSNSGKAQKAKQGLGARMRSYPVGQ